MLTYPLTSAILHFVASNSHYAKFGGTHHLGFAILNFVNPIPDSRTAVAKTFVCRILGQPIDFSRLRQLSLIRHLEFYKYNLRFVIRNFANKRHPLAIIWLKEWPDRLHPFFNQEFFALHAIFIQLLTAILNFEFHRQFVKSFCSYQHFDTSNVRIYQHKFYVCWWFG